MLCYNHIFLTVFFSDCEPPSTIRNPGIRIHSNSQLFMHMKEFILKRISSVLGELRSKLTYIQSSATKKVMTVKLTDCITCIIYS